MGRRKIEIKAIKDDRNRSVTFLKRKGGLFKKAHELSVLCSVDVAVIIFGQNKKLYEFSSGDINHTLARYQYYGVPHEHKGPADFADKGGGDDDDDEDEAAGSPPQETVSPPHHGIISQHPIQNQPGYSHMRQSEPSSSPPIQNGMYHGRMSTPQPNDGSRPSSRTAHIRRQSSNLVPQQHQHPQVNQTMMQNQNYSYPQMPSMYQQQHPAATANMHVAPPQASPPLSHHHYTHPLPQQSHMQHLYAQDQRRSSMPPSFPGNTQAGQPEHQNAYHTPPQHQRHAFQSPPLPEPQPQLSHQNQANVYYQQNNGIVQDQPRQPQQSQSIDSHTQDHYPRPGPGHHQRSTSADMSMLSRSTSEDIKPQIPFNAPAPAPATRPTRTTSNSISIISAATPASRVNSLQSDAKRPRLTVQIPGEASSDGGNISPTSSTSPKDPPKPSTITPAKTTGESTHSGAGGLVLPAPSPRSASAGAVLSAGATGPSNPFARPNIPLPPGGASKGASNIDAFKDNIASPMSALPSRVMAENGFMSSPSSMFPELGGFGANNLASPAVYQPTPIQMSGPSFRDPPAGVDEKKRKSPENGNDRGANGDGERKKVKT